MNKKIIIVDEDNNQQVELTVKTRAMQTTLLRIASISELKAIVQPDTDYDDGENC